MSCCVDTIPLCLIRGDVWTLDVGLSSSWTEVQENPTGYIAKLKFREDQDDDLPIYLELQATAEVDPDPLPGDLPIYFSFTATAQDTQTLPDWDHVALCELIPTLIVPDQPTRLFNANVKVSD